MHHSYFACAQSRHFSSKDTRR